MAESNEVPMSDAADRVFAAATKLESLYDRLESRPGTIHTPDTGTLEGVVATVDPERASLESRIGELEQRMSSLFANSEATARTHGRRTMNTSTTTLLAKQDSGEQEAAAGPLLDLALANLSIEQRIAVKAQLIRAGLLN